MPASLYKRWSARIGRVLAAVARKLGRTIYLHIALVFTVMVLLDAGELHLLGTMQRNIFDLLVSHRFVQSGPDPDLVIVDIDEKSLATLSGELGLWPWPRQAIAEWLDGVEAQRPKAVVFDILFSDPDVRNPDGDARLDAAIARTDNTYFPMLRLGQSNDSLSQIRPSMLPGVSPLAGVKMQDAPLAIVLPILPAAIAGGRLGVENAEPDADSVIRRQPAWLEHAGWRIPHLSLRVAEALGGHAPDARVFLLNWRGQPLAYKYVSFSDSYLDLQKKNRQRPAGEFAGKTILIGATAPSLFDVRATPTAKIFPGVEILATAIDNLKHGDYLRQQPPWATVAVALVFIWAMALALWRHIDITRFDAAFTALQVAFVGAWYLALNYTNTYVDLSAPITLGVAYFTVARVWFNFSRSVLLGQQLALLTAADGGYVLRIAVISYPGVDGARRRALNAAIHTRVTASNLHPGYVRHPFGDSGLIGELFADMAVVYWITAETDAAASAAAATEARLLAGKLESLLPAAGGVDVHSGRFHKQPGSEWKTQGRAITIAAMQLAARKPGTAPDCNPPPEPIRRG